MDDSVKIETIQWDSDEDSDSESVTSSSSTASTWVSEAQESSTDQEETGVDSQGPEEEGICRYNGTFEEVQGKGKEKQSNPGYEALGTWKYDDEDGWVFRPYEQQINKPAITEEEVFWPHAGTRREEAEKYARRHQYWEDRKEEERYAAYLERKRDEAEWFEKESRQRRGPSNWEREKDDYYTPNNVNYSVTTTPQHDPPEPTWEEGFTKGNHKRRTVNKLATEPWWE